MYQLSVQETLLANKKECYIMKRATLAQENCPVSFFSFRITMIPSISCYTFISFDIITVVSAKKVTHCNTSFYFIIFLIHLFLFFIIFFTLAY